MSFVDRLEKAMVECQRFGQTRLLVDVRALEHPPLSGVDRYEMSHATAEIWDRSILLAMLVRLDQIDPERFGQKVAENRGLFVEPFTDDAAAREWLTRPRPLKGLEDFAGMVQSQRAIPTRRVTRIGR